MTRLDTRKVARGGGSAFAVAVIALGAGCTGRVYAGTANVEGPPVAVGTVEDDGDVVYVQGPPVVEVDTYPSVWYGGVNVYYVDGLWYQQGPRGWAYYRQEPPELGRQREERSARDHDARWVQPRGAVHRNHDGPSQPAQRSGAAEAQVEHRAPTEQARGEERPEAAGQPRGRGETSAPHPAPRRTAPAKRAPVHSAAPTRPERER